MVGNVMEEKYLELFQRLDDTLEAIGDIGQLGPVEVTAPELKDAALFCVVRSPKGVRVVVTGSQLGMLEVAMHVQQGLKELQKKLLTETIPELLEQLTKEEPDGHIQDQGTEKPE